MFWPQAVVRFVFADVKLVHKLESDVVRPDIFDWAIEAQATTSALVIVSSSIFAVVTTSSGNTLILVIATI